ncbi:hypothetical protein BO79DRAFT_208037 [Aspergillus costaricaensis CBS 115574]|uniref:Uncharacterized protein n=1 Tax=Aspergillus costaricaensis CBS 115574 TaxID=1448317 RepID=A0ACD1IM21_9EURO|nr:hypothetical protein BO79DRAFT_208037 [Aspergillus costaricaensis CBS 115574]RAK91163.1 hypothetical protein BO79DRAFT_208037 [Aspergillus costaricaensis CBS 115574]
MSLLTWANNLISIIYSSLNSNAMNVLQLKKKQTAPRFVQKTADGLVSARIGYLLFGHTEAKLILICATLLLLFLLSLCSSASSKLPPITNYYC